MNAKKVLESLEVQYSDAKTLRLDPLFNTLLDEEIDLFWKSNANINNAYVNFSINENGDILFNNITETNNIDFISINILRENSIDDFDKFAEMELSNILEKYSEKKKKEIASKKLELDMSIESLNKLALDEKKHKLLDKLLKEQ